MKTLVIAVFAALGATACAFADVYRWIAQDGRWSDAKNWRNDTVSAEGQTCPGAEDTVRFWPEMSVRVDVDGDFAVKHLELMQGTAGKKEAVVLAGEGSLVIGEEGGEGTTSYLLVYANRSLKLSGADVSVISGVQYVYEDAEMVVGEGSVYRPKYHYMIMAGGRLVLDGGEILELPGGGGKIEMKDHWTSSDVGRNIAYFDIIGGVFKTSLVVGNGIFRMSGGLVSPVNGGTVFSKYADVKVTGGELVLKTNKDYPIGNRGVIPDGGTLTLGSNAVLQGLGNSENPDLPLNGGEVRGDGRFVASENFSFTGGGRLTFGKGMNLSPGEDDPIDRAVMDVDSLVLGANISRPYNVDTGIGSTTGTNLHIYFPREVVFAATNSDWYVAGLKTVLHIEKGATVDTADRADGVTARQIHLRRPMFSHGAYLRTIGGGVGVFSTWTDIGARLSELSAGENSTCRFELQYNQTLKTDSLSLGRGATLGLTARNIAFYEAEEISFGENARIEASVGNFDGPVLPGFICGPLAVDQFAGAVRPQVFYANESLADIWDARFINGSLAFCRKGVSHCTAGFAGNRWTGDADGSFGNAANWSSGTVPSGTNTTAVFDGVSNTGVTVAEDGAQLYSIRFLDMAGPFVLGGGPLAFESRLYDKQVGCAVYSSSAFPVVISNDISRSWTGGNHSVIAVNSAGNGYIALVGGVDGYARFEARGDVRILGETKAWNVMMKPSGGPRPTSVKVYRGAELRASNQTLLLSGPQGGFEIMEGGEFTVDGTLFGYVEYGDAVAQRVDGLFDVRAPLGGTKGHYLVGRGRVRFRDTGSKATADYTIRLGEKVRFSAETFVKPIEVEGEPTLCSENAWEYAAGPLALPKGCVLTIDTQDPDTAAGYDCTFASEISGSGSLKVTGAGSLRLTAENSIAGGVTLDGGRLSYSKRQNFASLSGSGVLKASPDAGEMPVLNISGNADFTDIRFDCGALSESAGKGWITLAEASAVSQALPKLSSDRWKVRVSTGADGVKLLQVRRRTGIGIIVK